MRIIGLFVLKIVSAHTQKIMGHIAKSEGGWRTTDCGRLGPTVSVLCCVDEAYCAALVGLLWETVTHASSVRRGYGARIIEGLLPHSPMQVLRDKVVPAIITLTNDRDMDVRLSVMPCYALILKSAPHPTVWLPVARALLTYGES